MGSLLFQMLLSVASLTSHICVVGVFDDLGPVVAGGFEQLNFHLLLPVCSVC